MPQTIHDYANQTYRQQQQERDRLARLERLTAQRPAAGFRLGAVDDAGEGIDRVAVHHDVELGQIAFLIAVEVIVGAFLLAFPFIIRWAAIAGSGN